MTTVRTPRCSQLRGAVVEAMPAARPRSGTVGLRDRRAGLVRAVLGRDERVRERERVRVVGGVVGAVVGEAWYSGSMWPYASATVKHALRSPLSWVLLAAGTFTGWFATSAAILALDEVGSQGEPLTISTAQLVGVLLTLWLIGRGMDEDRHSGFAAAADVSGPGTAGRLLGRWLGATVSGAGLAVFTALAISSSSAVATPDGMLLLSTSIAACALVGAWCVLLGSLWRGGGATLGVFLLWVLGHLPWGVAPFLEGLPGRICGGLLPGPRAAGTLATLGYTSAAVAGLLLVTLAVSRPAEA